MKIFIPTRGRINRQDTLEYLKLFDPIMVVPQCEESHWKDYRRLVVPDHFKFSEIRQFIAEQDGDKHCVIDDDLKLYRRCEDSTKLRGVTEGEVFALLSKISRLLDKYAHGGVSAREGNNHMDFPGVENTRCMRWHFYRPEVLREERFDFREVVTKQDFHCTLWLLERGFPNYVISEFAHNQRGSNVDGGCSSYRTQEVMDAGAEKLATLHPEFVKVVEKETKSAWGGGVRKDVRIQWKKAFRSFMKYRNSPEGMYDGTDNRTVEG